MKMRVSIARALVTRLRFCCWTYPLPRSTRSHGRKLNDDLLALWAKAAFTVVFVTHSVFELVYLSQRVVVMAARPWLSHRPTMPIDAPPVRDSGPSAPRRTMAASCRAVSAKLVGGNHRVTDTIVPTPLRQAATLAQGTDAESASGVCRRSGAGSASPPTAGRRSWRPP